MIACLCKLRGEAEEEIGKRKGFDGKAYTLIINMASHDYLSIVDYRTKQVYVSCCLEQLCSEVRLQRWRRYEMRLE